jgi:sialidase-1
MNTNLLNKITATLVTVTLWFLWLPNHWVAFAREPNRNRSTSFEHASAGPFTRLATEVGIWTVTDGQAIVDNKHAKTGKHSLWLPGPRSVVELDVASGLSPQDELRFAAERWTARSPFSFRIEKATPDGWSEVFDGDKQIRVGRGFLSNVRQSLGETESNKLRFTVASPSGTGILIDDLRIAKPHPQTIVDVQVVAHTFPALVGNEACPLVKLKIETQGSLHPISVKSLEMSLQGTEDLSDIESVQVISTGQSDRFTWREPVATSVVKKADDGLLTFAFDTDHCRLSEGSNFVWIACKLRPTADIDRHVGASCKSVAFSSGITIDLDAPPNRQRLGIALRNAGDDGVNTYRIPGLATTNTGTLLAVYDARYRNGGDLPGDIDVAMSRSLDGGRTWEPMEIILDMGSDPVHRHDGVGDPAILVDRITGTIWVAALWSHGDRAWHGSGPGLKPEETGQLLLIRSDDDGLTWSPPINITAQVKDPNWCLILQGPGKGITMHDGTLVFAAQYQDSLANQRLPYSTVIYSTDRGNTWQVGSGAFEDTTEAQVVESQPGVLMLNCRYNRTSSRVVMTSNDLGKTWQRHPTSETALIEPHACMASLIDPGRETDRKSQWLLFSNPNSSTKRERITIKGSPDRGLTWPTENTLLLDEGAGAGYTCMTMIDGETLGIVYEGSQSQLTFQRIPLGQISNSTLPGP